jgi:hypothetical protein
MIRFFLIVTLTLGLFAQEAYCVDGFATTGSPSTPGSMGYKCESNNVCMAGYICTSEVGRNVGDVTNPKFNNWSASSIHEMLNRHKNYVEPCYSSGAENCYTNETHLSVIRNAANEIHDDTNQTGLELMRQDCNGNQECIDYQDILVFDLTQEIKEFGGQKDHGADCTHPEDCKSLSCGSNGKCEEIKICTCALEGEVPESGQRCCQDYDYNPEADPNLQTYTVGNDGACRIVEIPTVPYVDYTITLKEGGSCKIVENHGEGLKLEGQTPSLPPGLSFLGGGTQSPTDDFTLKDLIARDFLILAALEFLTSNPDQPDDCLFPKNSKQRDDFQSIKFNDLLHEKIFKPIKQSREQGTAKYNEILSNIAEQTQEATEKISAIDGFKTAVDAQIALKEFEKAFYYGGFEALLDGKVLEGKSIAYDIGHDYEHVRFDNRWTDKHLKQSRNVDKYDCRGKNTIYGRRSFKRRIEVKGGGGYHTNSYFIDPLYLSNGEFKSMGDRETGRDNYEGVKTRSSEDIKTKLRALFDEYIKINGGTIKIPGFTTFEGEVNTALNDQVFYYVWELFSDYSKKTDGGATWNLRSRHPVKNRVNSFYPKINATIVEVGYFLTQMIQAREAFIQCLLNSDGDLDPDGTGSPGSEPPPSAADPTIGQVEQIGGEVGSGGGTALTGPGFGGGTSVGIDVGAGTSNSGQNSNASLTNSGGAIGGLGSAQGRLGAMASKIRKATAKDLLKLQKAASANPSATNLIAAASSISDKGQLGAAKGLFSSNGKSLLGGFKGLDDSSSSNVASISQASGFEKGDAGDSDGGRTAYQARIDDDESNGRTAYQAAPNTEDENKLLADVQKEADKFKAKDNDSLWTKVTKAYARIGIPRLFSASALTDKKATP